MRIKKLLKHPNPLNKLLNLLRRHPSKPRQLKLSSLNPLLNDYHSLSFLRNCPKNILLHTLKIFFF